MTPNCAYQTWNVLPLVAPSLAEEKGKNQIKDTNWLIKNISASIGGVQLPKIKKNFVLKRKKLSKNIFKNRFKDYFF